MAIYQVLLEVKELCAVFVLAEDEDSAVSKGLEMASQANPTCESLTVDSVERISASQCEELMKSLNAQIKKSHSLKN